MQKMDFQAIGDVFSKKKDMKKEGGLADTKKPPAHEWQDLALRIIKELGVPGFKRNSVFKICKDNSKQFVETCLSDTKELCKTGAKWSYFFKLVSLRDKPDTFIK
ncbi:MAG: hypothetical protein PF572_04560 [Patescibacteria group bacterium]|jgi:hypothetical protein|nr:hypothetical protein [Patescibacteria group bacterium]